MRLLIVTQDFPPKLGGIETYALELASRLAGRFAGLHVVCPDQAGARAFDRQLPFAVHRVGGGSDALPVRAALPVAELVRREGLDTVLHAQWQTAAIGVALRRLGLLRRLAIAAHGKELLLRPLSRRPRAQGAYDAFRRHLLEAADVVLPVSRYTASLVAAEAPRARCAVVTNGVSAERFAGGDGQAFRAAHGLGQGRVLLTVSRLVPRKGIDDVLRCLPELARELDDVRYVVVGVGPDAARLQELAQRLGVSSRVLFVGALDAAQLRDAYAACDAFVLAPRIEPDSVEGFGLVLLEAAAAGRASVTTDAGGCAEAVRHGETGLIAPAGDSGALTSALRRVLRDRAYAAQLGARGREHALGAGSWERTADTIYALLGASEPEPTGLAARGAA